MAKRAVFIDDLPPYCTPEQVLPALPWIGRNLLYRMLQAGEIPARKFGRKYMISREALRRFLDTPQEPPHA